MSSQKGYSSQEKEDRLSAQFQTIEPVRTMQFGSTVVSHEFVYEVGTDAAEAGSTASVIVATAHSALRGDVIRLTSGALSGREVKVWSVATNSITLAETLPSAVAAAVTFQILRHKYPTVDASGNVNVNAVIVEAAVAADGGALPALTKVVSGYDGAAVQVLKTDANGELQVDVLSSALPSGAATEATLSTLATEATVSSLGTEATLSALNAKVTAVDTGNVTISSSALPSGAATEATLVTLATEATLSALSAKVIEADTDNVTIVSSVLPVGAATEATLANVATSANQTNGSQKSQIVDGAGDIVDVVALNVAIQATDKGLVTNTIIHGETTGGGGGYVDVKVTPSGALVAEVSGTVAATQSGTWNITNVSGTVSLPTGAATEVTLAAVKTAVELIDNTVSGSELQVDVVAALPAGTNNIGDVDVVSVVAATGRSAVTRSRNDYTSVNVTTGAYVQLVASLASAVNEVEIFDSSGQTLVLATGAAASEVDQVYVFPGGNGRIPLAIAAATRVSIKAVSATASAGEIAINFYS